ncbi:MAG: 2-oxoglutarate and iron-dependent oxygenase domain-containing protein, partial [Bacteroidia bacterium]
MTSTIISLDLNQFRHGTPEEKNDFVKKLGGAYEKIGFAAVYNHELSDSLTENLYKYTKEFYALPLEVKLKYQIAGIAGQR